MSDKLQRLELVWPGKNERVDVEPRILIEDAEKSYSADPKIQEKMNRQLFKQKPEIAPTFDNMLIHGDNLLALKALEAEYSGQIKCIYIDPPYNSDFAIKSVEYIISQKIADENSIIIIETDNEEKVLNELKKIDIEIIDKRRYGRATLIFIKIRKG